MVYFLISVIAVIFTAFVSYRAGYRNGAKTMANLVTSTLDVIKNIGDSMSKEESE